MEEQVDLVGLCSLPPSLCAGVQGRPVGNSQCPEMNRQSAIVQQTPSHSHHTQPSQKNGQMQLVLARPSPSIPATDCNVNFDSHPICSLDVLPPLFFSLLWSSLPSQQNAPTPHSHGLWSKRPHWAGPMPADRLACVPAQLGPVQGWAAAAAAGSCSRSLC